MYDGEGGGGEGWGGGCSIADKHVFRSRTKDDP